MGSGSCERWSAFFGMKPRVGIVIPARNAGATIGDTLAALQNAPGVDTDILVVDGESNDTTVAAAASYGVRVVSQPACGVYDAVNVGLAAVRGEWLTYINADDILYASVLADRISSAAAHDVTYGPVDFIDVRARHLHRWHSARPSLLLSVYRAGMSPLLQQGTLFRREVFERLGGFDTRWHLVADADFWFRALEHGYRFHRTTAAAVAAFRMHAHQLGRVYAAESREEHKAMTAHHGCHHRWHGRLASLAWRAGNWRSYIARALRWRLDGNGRRSLDGYALGPP